MEKTILSFEDFKFSRNEGKEIDVFFLDYFHFTLDYDELEKRAGLYQINKSSLIFSKDEQTAERILNFELAKGFSRLRGLFGRRAVYVHKNSGIPLIGTLSFGIVDRDTNAIEVKPISGCNLDCIFCSVSEGKSSKKETDFVVEEKYLVSELKAHLALKPTQKFSIHINPHGEPLLYKDLSKLIFDISSLNQVLGVILYTNGILLSKEKIDDFCKSGLKRLSISIHAIDKEKANFLSGAIYDSKHVLEMAKYARSKMDVILTPVFIKGKNEEEIEKIIEFAKINHLKVGIQNFLFNRLGRNCAKEIEFGEFYSGLAILEKKYDIPLQNFSFKEDFEIKQIQPTFLPFKTGEIVSAKIVCPGRFPNELIAESKNKAITIIRSSEKIGSMVNLKIIKSKHNIFIGEILKKSAFKGKLEKAKNLKAKQAKIR